MHVIFNMIYSVLLLATQFHAKPVVQEVHNMVEQENLVITHVRTHELSL